MEFFAQGEKRCSGHVEVHPPFIANKKLLTQLSHQLVLLPGMIQNPLLVALLVALPVYLE